MEEMEMDMARARSGLSAWRREEEDEVCDCCACAACRGEGMSGMVGMRGDGMEWLGGLGCGTVELGR